jgi:hypothetical protein
MPVFQRAFHHKFELIMGGLLLVGFWVRVSFMAGGIYHIDEFISMLAATMVAQRGLPILPSGLFLRSRPAFFHAVRRVCGAAGI